MRENIGLFIWVWILGANAVLLLLSGWLGGSQAAGSYGGRGSLRGYPHAPSRETSSAVNERDVSTVEIARA